MPSRKIPLVNNEIYHIFNRSVAHQQLFQNKRDKDYFLNSLEYYRFQNPPVRFSFFLEFNGDKRKNTLEMLYRKNKLLADIQAFCLMPNHYHLLLQQKTDNGISDYLRLVQNSYARYLNTKSKRNGSLFQAPFKAVRITSEDQFIHVARYIHLNPLTSYLLKELRDLATYDGCSYCDYLSNTSRNFINKAQLISHFKSIEDFKKFTGDNIDYQRKLNSIKHLLLE